MYTLWAGLLGIAELLILLVLWKGSKWRKEAAEWEKRQADKS